MVGGLYEHVTITRHAIPCRLSTEEKGGTHADEGGGGSEAGACTHPRVGCHRLRLHAWQPGTQYEASEDQHSLHAGTCRRKLEGKGVGEGPAYITGVCKMPATRKADDSQYSFVQDGGSRRHVALECRAGGVEK